MTDTFAGCGWRVRTDGDNIVVLLTDDWTARDDVLDPRAAGALLDQPHIRAMHFAVSDLGHWDSSLLVFLSTLRQAAKVRRIDFDQTGLPATARRLLALVPEEPRASAPVRPVGAIERLGIWSIGIWSDWVAFTTLVGETLLRTAAAARGKARMRVVDLITCMQDAGMAALPMVAVVNILVGGIVAFVGAIQLRRFGAGIYITDLVGIAEVREMAPLMTAIVMSGRTGSAYAAEIATMQGSEEIDALRAIGISVLDYLVLPRVSALTVVMPLLAIYAGALGILGGLAVAVLMLKIPAEIFVAQIRGAVTGNEILFGLAKSTAFGGWIALAGCRIGLKAGRSATHVGHAATTAAVSGIVGAIALDGLFDVCANALGI